MATCKDCKMFMPHMFICPTAGRIVRPDTDASMCKMGVARCGDCKMFMPTLFNCSYAKWGENPAAVQVSGESSTCDAFMPK